MPTSNDRIKQQLEAAFTKKDKDGSVSVPNVEVEGLGDELGPYTITMDGKTVKTVKTMAEVVAEFKSKK